MTRTRVAIAALLLLLPLCALAGPKGHLFIVGGGDWPDGMMNRFVDLAARFGTGRIVILPMASSVPKESAAEETEGFRKLGAKDVVTYILTRKQALKPESAALLDGAGGVFFSGGDQSRLTAVLLDTPVYKKLLELYDQGAVIGGTSAGAAVMSEVMITGDEVRKPEAGREFETLQAANVMTARGFGFVRKAVIDQHFVTRKPPQPAHQRPRRAPGPPGRRHRRVDGGPRSARRDLRGRRRQAGRHLRPGEREVPDPPELEHRLHRARDARTDQRGHVRPEDAQARDSVRWSRGQATFFLLRASLLFEETGNDRAVRDPGAP